VRTLKLTEREQVEFMMYYAGIVAMARHHPGAKYDKVHGGYNVTKLSSLEDCADEALGMIEVSRQVFAQ
jgi:hypothetical protein